MGYAQLSNFLYVNIDKYENILVKKSCCCWCGKKNIFYFLYRFKVEGPVRFKTSKIKSDKENLFDLFFIIKNGISKSN